MKLKSFVDAMSFTHKWFCVLFWLPALFFAVVAYSDYNMRGCYNNPDGSQCSDAFGIMMIACFVLAGPFFHLLYAITRKMLMSKTHA